MRKITALADCNNFFVSCEILKNPKLKGRPVCVLSNCDGCVISRSNEAKKMGIRMGIPFFMAKKEFPEAVYLSSDMKFYHEISKRVQKIFTEFAPVIQVYSIDEAFLDITELDKLYSCNYFELAKKLRDLILIKTGIPVSVGIANSKILCKIATDIAKKADFTHVIEFDNIAKEINEFPIEKIWGIGRNTTSLLRSFGIFTAGDILKKDVEFFKQKLGKRGLELKYGLAGEDVSPVSSVVAKPKSIQKTSSFETFTNNKTLLKETILTHLHHTCQKLRRHELVATEITVMLRTKDFKIMTATDKLDFPTSAEYLLNKQAVRLFETIYNKNMLYRSSGIYANELKDTESQQLLLLKDTTRFEKISQIWDKIEQKHGRGIFSIGSI